MVRDKIETYVGFCLRSRKIALGSGSIAAQKGKVFLILLSADAAKNTRELAIKYKNKFSCPLIICKNFARLVLSPSCKIAAIRDESLAKAIAENAESYKDNYELYAGGSI